mgnify:FL=1
MKPRMAPRRHPRLTLREGKGERENKIIIYFYIMKSGKKYILTINLWN